MDNATTGTWHEKILRLFADKPAPLAEVMAQMRECHEGVLNDIWWKQYMSSVKDMADNVGDPTFNWDENQESE